jgi:hypothetical protein
MQETTSKSNASLHKRKSGKASQEASLKLRLALYRAQLKEGEAGIDNGTYCTSAWCLVPQTSSVLPCSFSVAMTSDLTG